MARYLPISRDSQVHNLSFQIVAGRDVEQSDCDR